jgi:hypothetical protein
MISPCWFLIILNPRWILSCTIEIYSYPDLWGHLVCKHLGLNSGQRLWLWPDILSCDDAPGSQAIEARAWGRRAWGRRAWGKLVFDRLGPRLLKPEPGGEEPGGSWCLTIWVPGYWSQSLGEKSLGAAGVWQGLGTSRKMTCKLQVNVMRALNWPSAPWYGSYFGYSGISLSGHLCQAVTSP